MHKNNNDEQMVWTLSPLLQRLICLGLMGVFGKWLSEQSEFPLAAH